jgi:hypothetical protein
MLSAGHALLPFVTRHYEGDHVMMSIHV